MNVKDDHPLEDVGCLEVLESLYSYIDGDLDDPEYIAQLEHHMDHCRSCFGRAEMERVLLQHIKETEETRAPDALKARMKKLMEKF